MSVFHGSRYEGLPYTTIPGSDDIPRKWLHPRTSLTQQDVNSDWILYTVTVADSLDDIAFRFAGSVEDKERLWWLIAEVNGILWPLDLIPGQQIIIPVRELNELG